MLIEGLQSKEDTIHCCCCSTQNLEGFHSRCLCFMAKLRGLRCRLKQGESTYSLEVFTHTRKEQNKKTKGTFLRDAKEKDLIVIWINLFERRRHLDNRGDQIKITYICRNHSISTSITITPRGKLPTQAP